MVEMRLPTPSDLCWNAKFPPEQAWIEQTTRIAVGNIWQRVQQVARAQLGDESFAPEIMEVAIEGAIIRLQTGSRQGHEDVAQLLKRLFLQEVKRRRKASNRLVYVGSSQELPTGSAQDPHTRVDSAIDLEKLLHDSSPEVRMALLLRYSGSQWSEVGAVLGTSEDAARLRCTRALDKIRQEMEVDIHET